MSRQIHRRYQPPVRRRPTPAERAERRARWQGIARTALRIGGILAAIAAGLLALPWLLDAMDRISGLPILILLLLGLALVGLRGLKAAMGDYDRRA